MTTPVNPKEFTIVDATAAAEGVTGLNVAFGRTSGGPYTMKVAIPAKDLTTLASGTIKGPFADIATNLAAGHWFCVTSAVNSLGESSYSPEAAFDIVPPVPSAPTSFSLA